MQSVFTHNIRGVAFARKFRYGCAVSLPKPRSLSRLPASGGDSHPDGDFSPSIARRRAVHGLLTFLTGAQLCPAPALSAPEQQATEVDQVQALIALLDGQEALGSALRVKGSAGPGRLRLRNLLPKYSGAVQTMTAYLPAAIAGVPGPEDDKEWVAAANNILIGTSQVVSMARFAAKGEFDNFTDEDIPYNDIDLAVQSVGDVLSKVPQETLERANRARCRRRLNAARDLEEMKELANSSICAVGM